MTLGVLLHLPMYVQVYPTRIRARGTGLAGMCARAGGLLGVGVVVAGMPGIGAGTQAAGDPHPA